MAKEKNEAPKDIDDADIEKAKENIESETNEKIEELKKKGADKIKQVKEDLEDNISVKEIEEFAQSHKVELFLSILFIFAGLFSLFSAFRAKWMVFSAVSGVVASLIAPSLIKALLRQMIRSISEKQTMAQLMIGAVLILVAIFMPPLIFLMLGLFGGSRLYQELKDSFESKQ